MDLSDALGDWPSGGNNQSGGPWPANPNWPGQPATNPTWPGGQPAPNPTWPGGQPAPNPTWPGGQPAPNPTWPGGQPAPNPMWPGGQPASNPAWPGGQSGGNNMWPGGNPSQPTAPGGFPSGPGSNGPGPAIPAAPYKNLAVPYEERLPMGIYDKLLITIRGTVKPNAEKFAVNLSAGNDIAFHFNPRFNEAGRKALVRNSLIGEKWGKEERNVNQFPFVLGQPFEMKILCTNTEFKVAVNNSHVLEYKHRLTNLRSINKLGILFDLTLSDVCVENI
ncbi:galectin-3-like [Poecilia latipinna]|uniref:galectin-3b n=1 Tax=Poecilia latipinna TaxID=48699 RepID=UPI00072DF4DF|nr:PREDICTED: galectin-3-like [Poecilia latipinna]XP_014892042.1 PREDICTED: galectin-3-like [Poecilia latipinna]